jgi:cholesterol transport system auxiliary component
MSDTAKLERRFFLVGAAALTLSACSNLIGPAGDNQLYLLKPEMAKMPGPPVGWRLSVTRPDAPQNLDTTRISISRTPTTMDYYAGALWGDRLSELVQTLTVQAFENTGRIASVAEDSVGAQHDYILNMDIRNFEARYDTPDGAPVGVVRIHAKLITQLKQVILGNYESAHEVAASANSIDAAVVALDAAFGQVLADIVGWTLRTGPALPA